MIQNRQLLQHLLTLLDKRRVEYTMTAGWSEGAGQHWIINIVRCVEITGLMNEIYTEAKYENMRVEYRAGSGWSFSG